MKCGELPDDEHDHRKSGGCGGSSTHDTDVVTVATELHLADPKL